MKVAACVLLGLCAALRPVSAHEQDVADNPAGLSDDEIAYLRQLPELHVPLLPAQPPLTFIENGEPRGYLNELFEAVADKLGLRYRRTVSGYIESIAAVKAGEADLLNDYSSSGDRSQYLLETRPVLTSPFVAVGRAGSETVRDIKDLTGKRLVMVSGFQQTRVLAERYPELNMQLVDTIDEAYRTLRSEDADYYIDNATHAGYYLRHHLISDLEIAGELPAEAIGRLKLHFAVARKHLLLHSALEKMLSHMQDTNELTWLRNKWLYRDTNRYKPQFTAAEQDWLKANPNIRVVLDPDWAPVEYRTEAGDYEGMSLDYLALLEPMLGVRFDVIEGLSWQQGVNALKSKQADMFASVARTPQREAYLLFTHPYIDMPIRIFARDDVSYIGNLDNLEDKRIAVVAGYAILDWLRNQHPELNLVTVETPADGLRQVAAGEVDAFIGNVVTATYYIGKLRLDNVRLAGETPYANAQAMAVRDDWTTFAAILQKALDAIPPNEHKSIYNRWMSIRFEHAVDYRPVWWVVLTATLVLAGIFYWNRVLDRQVKARTAELETNEIRIRHLLDTTNHILEGTHAGTWDWTIPTRKLVLNERWANIIGYDLDELAPVDIDTWFGSVHSEDLPTIEQALEMHFNGRKDYFDVEFRQRHKNSHWVWINARGKVVEWDEDGNPLRMSGTHLDITARKQAEETILHQAHYDALTGLPNRFLTLDRLSQLILDAGRREKKVGVLFLDLDDFKKINDTLGHDTGDQILVDAAKRLRRVVRGVDTIGRLGGDEFIVLVGNLESTADLLPVADQLLESFRSPFSLQGRELMLTASIGISIYPDDAGDAVKLLRNADSAMYHSKAHGRNTYAFYTRSMNRDISRRVSVEEQMAGALERGEFHLLYQPKVEIRTRRIIGAEALLRWDNALLGKISPAEFIPLAEHTGMIVPIGEFVLEQALMVAAQLNQRFDRQMSMAINLSPRQFRDPNLVAFFESRVETCGVPWTALELEITEGVLMTGLSYIERALSVLSGNGASLAMDDFGTGYSSLSYLRQFPFTVLKIDRSFIKDITHDGHGLELVNATIAMAHSLGLKVVAEGVETAEQLALLQAQECDIAQGYLFGRPVAPDALMEMIQANA